jgi:hypothetical protein
VGGEKDGGAGAVQVGDQLAQLPGAGHVDARGGLVQEQDPGPVDDAGGDGQLALHALGIAAEPAVGGRRETEIRQQLPGAGLAHGLAHAVERGTEAEIVEAAELRVEIALVGHHAHQMLGRPGLAGAVDPADPDRARVGARKAGEHVDGGGLAGTVGTQETEQLTLRDAKGDPVDGLDLAETLGQVFNENSFAHGASPPCINPEKTGAAAWRTRQRE